MLTKSDRYGTVDIVLSPLPEHGQQLLHILQKAIAKKKASRTGGKKEEWHGLSLEEKNEIVSTEIEIYQAAIERVS